MIRISVPVKAAEVKKFSTFLDKYTDGKIGLIQSFGEKVHKKNTTFFITFYDAAGVWKVSAAWRNLQQADEISITPRYEIAV
jgi:hypothetical protein